MAAIEYPTILQSSTPSSSSSSTSVSVLFTFPFDYNSKPTPESVQVTGSFNSWDRTPMSKNQTASRFESTVEIDLTAHNDLKDDNNKVKILFKFVLDGQDWVTDAEQPLERDQQGNLNNVLILDVPVIVGKAQASSSLTTTPLAEQETDAQKIARQKQEEEDDAVIRQLGGGMWGAPMFAVNDPVSLPEHFVESSSQEADNTDDKDKETVEEKEKGQEVQETTVTASPATEKEIKQETEEERAARLKEEENDAIIRKFGGGMWGAPMFAVNDPVNLPEHFPENVTEAAPPAPEITETPSVSAPGLVSPAAAPVVVPTVEEDEDDVIIRQLGGGMWGAPNFKVNDPANLPEHFVEAVMKDPEVSSSSTKSNRKEKAAESVAVAEKVVFTAPIANSSSAQTIVEGQVVKEEFVKTLSGTLIETVVETTEDIVIQAPDGTILEETFTTDVQESVQGVLLESVTETTEIIEEIEEPVPGTNNASVAVEGVTEVVMMEEEEIKIVQGEDGVATTIVEDTITFMDGPEVDSSSLHSITTSIKLVQEGESFLVEQAPAVHVDSVEILTSAPGYAKPSVDLSADVVAIPLSNVSSARTRVNGDEHDGDNNYGVIVLQGEPLTSGRQSVAGDAKPSIDMSVSTAQTIIAPSPSPGSPSKAEPGLKTVKSEKRKSGLWKKIKNVLS
ncbi:hypothetical protein BG006_006893 [Podila minutissima]|uniref:AMP-activated protein kinase glycogen-binding domain-containing protein n=1 Tax=Podila minutissima TaxID=64525 RepID=A0A9P5VQU6_9FUNG|nr:hypothetical protein BG006_006893 [Podila minutissima]